MLQVLNTINKESLRQSQVTTYTTPYELVTERDIAIARLDVSHTLLPKCKKLLVKVNGLLHKLGQDELDILKSLDRQTLLVHKLKQNPQTQPVFLDTRQRTSRREEIEHKKKQLEYLVRVEEEKNHNVNVDIAKIKANNEELRKDRVQSNGEYEETRNELIQELSRLEAEADLKMKQSEIKQLSNVKMPESGTTYTRTKEINNNNNNNNNRFKGIV
ncbi:hypothetical protein INT48_000390 [Thamnidium elegans]|uniref:Uncharacterized protein n=1 Tax=Thamnidium elegans TaxID=101142 RepID=A0A8H7SQE1_9FUNG|nr:hypothetical protein INT48_000390 [Thamnidium elegans]